MLFTILILISGFAVVSVISQILMDRKCPSQVTLEKVVLGLMPGESPTARKVKRHLGICASCRGKVDDLITLNPTDTLIEDD